MTRHAGRARGFALIIVLWTLVLLTFLVTEIEQAGRGEASLAFNLRRAAALQAEADGGVAAAAYHLLGGAPGWAADGQDHALTVTDDAFTRRLLIRIDDEAGKIDLNRAPAPLLQALLAAVGEDATSAGETAGNIVAWRSPANLSSSPYQAAGLPYAPPGAAFESLDELRLVPGVTPALLTALLPHLTLNQFSGTDLALADPVVRRAYATAGPLVAAGGQQQAAIRVVTITVTASGGGAAAARQAVVRVGPQPSGWMQILTWSRPGA